MNVYQARGAREPHPEDERPLSEYEIILKFSVRDTSMLWRAAAQRLCDNGLDAEDVDETIGPVEDPAVRDCLIMLSMPAAVDGLDLVEFDIRPGGKPPLVLTKSDIISPGRSMPVGPLPIAAGEVPTPDWRTGIDTSAICVCGNLTTPDQAPALPN